VKRVVVAAIILAMIVGLVGCTKAAPPKRMLLGTSSATGTYYVYGAGWAKILNDKLKTVDVSVEITGGPSTNIQLIQKKEMDIGFVTTWLAGEGFNGEGWAAGQKHDRIRAIFPMYSSVLHIYTLAKTNVRSIQDVNGKHISSGAPGSTSEAALTKIVEALDLKPRIFSKIPSNQAIDGMKDGSIDVGFNITGIPGPFMMDLETTHEVRHISLTPEEVATILELNPYWAEGVIPNGTYKHQTEDIRTISFWNVAVVDKDLPESLVYDIVKATFANHSSLLTVDPNAKDTLAKNIVYSSVPLHPGAIKYYKEIGITLPDRLVPK